MGNKKVSQWKSQTRKMNNHYQSAGKSKDYWTFPRTAIYLNGVEIADGQIARFPFIMNEPNTTWNAGNNNISIPTIPVNISTVDTPAKSCHYVYTDTSTEFTYDIYAEIFDASIYELEATTQTVYNSVYTAKHTEYITKLDGNKILLTGEKRTTTLSENPPCIIPTIERTPFIFYIKRDSTELPSNLQYMADFPIIEFNGIYQSPFDIVCSLLPEYNKLKLPGIGPAGIATTYFDFRNDSWNAQSSSFYFLGGYNRNISTGTASSGTGDPNSVLFEYVANIGEQYTEFFTGASVRSNDYTGTGNTISSIPYGYFYSFTYDNKDYYEPFATHAPTAMTALFCNTGNAELTNTGNGVGLGINGHPPTSQTSNTNIIMTGADGEIYGFIRRLKSARIDYDFKIANVK